MHPFKVCTNTYIYVIIATTENQNPFVTSESSLKGETGEGD